MRPLILGLTVITLTGAVTLLTLKGQDKPGDNKQEMRVLRRSGQAEGPTEKEILDQLPIADAFSNLPAESEKRAERQKKNARYDKARSQDISEADYPLGVIFNTHWSQGLPALPIDESQVIVLAHVIDSNAYLSNDRTGIYSEFTANVKELFKNATTSSLANGSQVVFERLGGAVRFASGKIQTYRVSNQRMPLKGRSYVLFLKKVDDASFALVTGYEVHGQQIRPLDGNGPGSNLPFEVYRNADVGPFIEVLRASVAKNDAERNTNQ